MTCVVMQLHGQALEDKLEEQLKLLEAALLLRHEAQHRLEHQVCVEGDVLNMVIQATAC